jgi:hypothetical protein
MKRLSLILVSVIISSCSIQKRANRALDRIGADPLLIAIHEKFPDKFIRDTLERTITVTKVDTFKVMTTEAVVDTFLFGIKDTCRFDYEDKNVIFSLDGSRFRYFIKRKLQTVIQPTTTKVKCPDCPPIPKVPAKEKAKDYTMWWIIGIVVSFFGGLFIGKK